MLSALLSFFGGTAFRMLWGEISAYLNKRQDHKFEIERMQLQEKFDAAQHDRNLAALKFQAEQQVKVIEVAARGEVDKTLAEAWSTASKATTTLTGIWLIDLWNAAIRPAGATWALVMISLHEAGLLTNPLTENTQMVAYAFIGLFVADRTLGKRGK